MPLTGLKSENQMFPSGRSQPSNRAKSRMPSKTKSCSACTWMRSIVSFETNLRKGTKRRSAMDGSPLSGGQKQRIGLARPSSATRA